MKLVLTSWKPMLLLVISKVTMIALIALSMLGAIRSIENGRNYLDDFYQHPFAVSKAASMLASSAAEIRTHMLQMTLESQVNKINEHSAAIAHKNTEIDDALATINQQFLGDMARVKELNEDLADWAMLRQQIFLHIKERDRDVAILLAKDRGDELFHQILSNAEYISGFAQNKANEYVRNAHSDTQSAITNLYLLTTGLTLLLLAWSIYLVGYFYRNHKSLEEDAHTDPLTGLLRRGQFQLLAEQVIKASRRSDTPFSLLMLDIDDFKQINDTHGHTAGDMVIQSLAATLKEMLRESDLIARWGGEEFLILMPEISESEAAVAADRIRENCASKTVQFNGTPISFTISGGIRESTGHILLDISLEEADQCLYLAKDAGKNRIVAYSETQLSSGIHALA